MEQNIDLGTYWRIAKRRKWFFLLPAGAILILSSILSYVLPPKYISKATILVEAQSVPEKMVQSTVSVFIEEQIQSIKQVILARQNLIQIIERLNLFPDLRETGSIEEVVAAMRDRITLETLEAETDKRESTTIAFTLSYEGDLPEKTAQVASILASQFMEENSRLREQKAKTTVDFLQSQLQQLESKLDQIERDITAFKNQHLYTLPSMLQINMTQQQRIQENIDTKRNEIQKLQDRKIFLESRLLLLESNGYSLNQIGSGRDVPSSPEEYYQRLYNQYLALKAAHSATHPDVISLKKQVEALKEELQSQKTADQIEQELVQKESELTRLQQMYSDKYPDVVQLRKEIKELERHYQNALQDPSSSSEEKASPENPASIELHTKIESTNLELESTKHEIRELREAYRLYQQRLEQAPKIEQQYNALQRKYASLQEAYKETQAKLLDARESQEMEKQRMSQKLRLIDAPAVPEQPSSPNRLALLLVGGVLAVGFGVGCGSLAEFLDRTVYNAKQLASLTQQPVLIAVPIIHTWRDIRRRRLKRFIFSAALVLSLVIILYGIHAGIRPLDLIWLQIQDKYSGLLQQYF